MLLPRKSGSPQEGRDDMRKIVDSVRSIVQTLRNSARDSEQKLGISSAQLYVLQELQDVPSLSINQLAERTYTHQSSVSMVVGKLVGRRLVTRSSAKGDARMVAISLTPAGRAMLRRSPGSGQARLVKALKSMSRADLRTLSANLKTLNKALQA
jgi:DNA-binding MarR family transcriptional regulator